MKRIFQKFIQKNKEKIVRIIQLEGKSFRYYYCFYKILVFFELPVEEFKVEFLLNKIIKLSNDPKLLFLLAKYYLEKEEIWQAEIYFGNALSLIDNPKSKWYVEYAEILKKMNKLIEAQYYLEKAIKLDIKNSYWYFKLGDVQKKNKNFDRANKNFEYAIKFSKNNEVKKLGVGVYYEENKDWDGALEEYKSHGEKIETPMIIYKIALANEMCYKWKEAENGYKEYLKMKPNSKKALFRLGIVLEKQLKWKEASSLYEGIVIKRKTFNSDFYYRWGYSLNEIEDYEKACIALTKMYGRENLVYLAKIRVKYFFKKTIQRKFEESDPIYILKEGRELVKKEKFKEAANKLLEVRLLGELNRREKYLEYYERLSVEENIILYENYSDNIIESLLIDDFFKSYRHIIVENKKKKIPKKIIEAENVELILQESELYLEYLSKSKLLINGHKFPNYFIRKQEQIYLSTKKSLKSLDLEEVCSGKIFFKKDTLQVSHVLVFSENEGIKIKKFQLTDIKFKEKSNLKSIREDNHFGISEEIKKILITKENLTKTPEKKCKKSLLFYGGAFSENGITISFINLVNSLDKEKFDVYIVVNKKSVMSDEKKINQLNKVDNNVKFILREGPLTLRKIESNASSLFEKSKKFVSVNSKKNYYNGYRREYLRCFSYHEFDAVINFQGYTLFWLSLLTNRINLFCKRIVFLHNDMESEWKTKYPYLEKSFRIYSRYDDIVSVSSYTSDLNKKKLSEKFGLEESKFKFFNNLQDQNKILKLSKEAIRNEKLKEELDGEKVFINIGRLSPEKGQKKLIRAFKKITQEYSNIKLFILGEGPLKNELIEEIEKLDLKNKVFLLGQRTNPYKYLKKSFCYISASNHEGQPMTLFEAMILKKPIIATDIVGNRSVIEGRTGLLVENSEIGLYVGMKKHLDDEYKESNNFKTEIYNRESLNLFYNILEGDKR